MSIHPVFFYLFKDDIADFPRVVLSELDRIRKGLLKREGSRMEVGGEMRLLVARLLRTNRARTLKC